MQGRVMLYVAQAQQSRTAGAGGRASRMHDMVELMSSTRS